MNWVPNASDEAATFYILTTPEESYVEYCKNTSVPLSSWEWGRQYAEIAEKAVEALLLSLPVLPDEVCWRQHVSEDAELVWRLNGMELLWKKEHDHIAVSFSGNRKVLAAAGKLFAVVAAKGLSWLQVYQPRGQFAWERVNLIRLANQPPETLDRVIQSLVAEVSVTPTKHLVLA